MKVLVTGGAGFIGSHIVDLLIEYGHTVIVVDNLTTGNRANVNTKATFYELDILDSRLDEVINHERPEVISHQAALVYVQQSIKNPMADGNTNALGTLNMLRLAYLNNVRKFIYASTCAVYGGVKSKATEGYCIKPISFYGASKYMGEIYIQLYNQLYQLDYTILRYANVYGPRQKPLGEGGVIPIFINNIKNNISSNIFGDGSQTRDFTYVKDIAKASLLSMQKGSRKILNISTGKPTSIWDLYQMIIDIHNKKLQPKFLPERKGDVKHIYLDPSRAKMELGWTADYSLKEGLNETVKSII